MKITTEITKTRTNVEVTKQNKDFLKAYYKKALSMALDALEDDDLEEIFHICYKNGKIAYKFNDKYLLYHFKNYLIDGIAENYELYDIEWNENGENKSLKLSSLVDVEEDYYDDDLFELLRDCCCLSIDEEVYNEILLPIFKEQTELLMKKTGIIGVVLGFKYNDKFKYSDWRLIMDNEIS